MKDFDDIKSEAANEIAIKMIISAKTAPKGRGIESMEYKIIEKDDFQVLISKMTEIAQKEEIPFLKEMQKT